MALCIWPERWKTNGISIFSMDILYFARSWSGVLVYKAAIDFQQTQAIISSIDAIGQTTTGWILAGHLCCGFSREKPPVSQGSTAYPSAQCTG